MATKKVQVGWIFRGSNVVASTGYRKEYFFPAGVSITMERRGNDKMDIELDEFICSKEGCNEKIKRADVSTFGHWLISEGYGVRCVEHDNVECMTNEELVLFGDLWNRFVEWCNQE